MAEIGDCNDFDKAEQLAAWFGLVPSVYNSADLKNFSLRIQAKKGTNIAAVALARKVLCIVHHLLTVQEMYQEEEREKEDDVEYLRIPKQMMSLEDMIRYVAKAGYEVRKITPGAG